MGQKYAISQQPNAPYRVYKGGIGEVMPRIRHDHRRPMSIFDVLLERHYGDFHSEFRSMAVTTADVMAWDPRSQTVKFVRDSDHVRNLKPDSIEPNPYLTAIALPDKSYEGIDGLELILTDATPLSVPAEIRKEGAGYKHAINEQQRRVWEYLARSPRLVRDNSEGMNYVELFVRKNGARIILPPLNLLFELDRPVIIPITITSASYLGPGADLVVGENYFPANPGREPEIVGVKTKTLENARQRFEAHN